MSPKLTTTRWSLNDQASSCGVVGTSSSRQSVDSRPHEPRVERRTARGRAPRPARARGTPGCACGSRRAGRRGTAGRPGTVAITTAAARARAPERRRRARLVVVLDEAQQLRLVRRVGLQVAAHRRRVLVREPVVEPLVVAVVEALLLQRVLHVPVGLGDEDQVVVRSPRARTPSPAARGARCARRPRWSSASPCRSARRRTSPPAAAQQLAHRRPQRGRERVELDDVRPRREVRVAPAGDDRVADAQPRRRVAREVLLACRGCSAPAPTDDRARRGWGRSRGSASARARRAPPAPRRGRRSADRRRSRARSRASRSRPRRAGPAAPPASPPSARGRPARSPARPASAPTRPSARPRRRPARSDQSTSSSGVREQTAVLIS